MALKIVPLFGVSIIVPEICLKKQTEYTILFILMANIIDTARIMEVCNYQFNITSMKTIFCKIVKNAKHGIDLL